MSNDLLNRGFLVSENHRNVHTFSTNYWAGDWSRQILMISDPHWDNPKCNRELLKRHLDDAVTRNAKIIINGDLFCLMQGWGDPRSNKSDIRPEHNNKNYLDSIIETAVEWFAPYAGHIALIGRGNHESSVQKRRETDILQRFTDMMNLIHRPEEKIHIGGYGGWVRFMFDREKSKDVQSVKMKYFHGAGKDPEVTMGMIGNHRRQSFIANADIIWTGHIHQNVEATMTYETLNAAGNVELRDTEHIITSTYKEEYVDGHGGWHVERGARPKPLGGRWLEFYLEQGDVKFDHFRAK